MNFHTIQIIKKGLMLFCIVTVSSLMAFGQNKKNVLLILVDDLKPNLGAYGDPIAVSPNIDRLASMGTKFDLAYCNQAVCMASRYNLMLGSRSTSTGFYQFGTQFREVYPDAVTLPQHFQKAGYHTESMGKVFHIGHGNDNDVASWSIPHHKEKVIEYLLPESTGRKLTREEAYFQNSRMYLSDLPPRRQLPRGAAWEAPDVLDEAYADGRVASHAINRLRILQKKPEQPFFMAVGFARPHLPFCVPKKYWDMYDRDKLPMPEFEADPEGTPSFAVKRRGEIDQFTPIPENGEPFSDDLKSNLIHGYYASMSYMDAQLGRVIKELERLNMMDNTIIVLWGDHGWHLGDHKSWTKHSNFEQANRIPLLFIAPGVAKAGSSTNQLAETVDVYPTLAELAGLPKPSGPQPIDGLSLVPVLKNSEYRVRDHAYHSFPKRKLIGCAIRTERYRMVEWRNPRDPDAEKIYELYDYLEDPLETRNYAQSKKKVLKELIAILETHPDAKPQVAR
ncbi:MAG: iduronate 2-sulfatase [Cyclobacteriaceae bacterium]|jgi:iduronate 2-sulfatase